MSEELFKEFGEILDRLELFTLKLRNENEKDTVIAESIRKAFTSLDLDYYAIRDGYGYNDGVMYG